MGTGESGKAGDYRPRMAFPVISKAGHVPAAKSTVANPVSNVAECFQRLHVALHNVLTVRRIFCNILGVELVVS